MTAIKFEEFFDNKSLDKLAELYGVITKENLSVKDTGINYRVINHWDEKGLIRFARNSTEGYRKFSFVDFIWIKVVNELRDFGVKLPDIQKITTDLYEPLPMKDFIDSFANNLGVLKDYEGREDLIQFIKSGEYKTADFSLFEFNYLQILIAEAIATRKPVSLFLFKNGDWFPFIHDREQAYPEELLYKKEYSSHISVSLTDIIFRHIVEDELKPYLNGINIFTRNELAIISHVKEGGYKKIIVVLKDKKEAAVEIKKGKDTLDRIMKIIRLKQYKEFVLIDNKNNEVRIGKSNTEKNRPFRLYRMEKKKKRLSIAELKGFKGYDKVSDEEAEYVISSLEKISILFLELFQTKKDEMEKALELHNHNEIKIETDYDKRNAA